MNPADVQVTVEGGVADIRVNKPGITVEVRDYDVEGVDDDHELLWTDEIGNRCMRYFALPDELPAREQPPAEHPTTPSLGG